MLYNYLKREKPGHTLQPTALANEAFLKIVDLSRMEWKDRAHFFAVAATLMRRILVDYARRGNSEKRGGGKAPITLDEAPSLALNPIVNLIDIDVLALDKALEELASRSPRQSRIVELRFFGGLNMEEIAEVLEISVPTVERDLRFAKQWLQQRLR